MIEKVIEGSSQINKLSYDPESKTLNVLFKTDKEYAYFDVTQNEFDGLIAAESAGKFLNQNIKGKKEYKLIEQST